MSPFAGNGFQGCHGYNFHRRNELNTFLSPAKSTGGFAEDWQAGARGHCQNRKLYRTVVEGGNAVHQVQTGPREVAGCEATRTGYGQFQSSIGGNNCLLPTLSKGKPFAILQVLISSRKQYLQIRSKL